MSDILLLLNKNKNHNRCLKTGTFFQLLCREEDLVNTQVSHSNKLILLVQILSALHPDKYVSEMTLVIFFK